MPPGKRTSLPQAAQAKALADIGYQGTQIADPTGLLVRTVDDIINGRNGWREIIANDQAFKQYRTRPKDRCRRRQSTFHRRLCSRSKTESTRPVRHEPRWSTASCATRNASMLVSLPRSSRCTHGKRLTGWMRLPRYWGRRCYREGKRSM